jgi:leukotriene-A4 hydrolase
LRISLPTLTFATGSTFKVAVSYSTTDASAALQWLEPAQTAGKHHPYLFTQCQAIHARSLVPCQDTPFIKTTYSAKVTVPKPLTAVMSALAEGEVTDHGDSRSFCFTQPVPTPSYLIALGVGNLASKELGPRSCVWAEPEVVDDAQWEFAETESFIAAAEGLVGPYVWGRYDLLMLPPSFPYGGMENPCLTFGTVCSCYM